jgi:LacI family transcriptional regulator
MPKLTTPSIPKRLTLVDEVTDILRTGLREGRWKGFLPGERLLSSELRVSRPTVRNAVELLVAEGWVTNQGRFRRKILRAPEALPESNAVVLLSPVPIERMEPHLLLRVDYIRGALAAENLNLSVVHGSRYFSQQPETALEELVRERPGAVWLLNRSNEQMQRWFDARGLAVLIMGSEFPGVELCSLDYELAAVCRHAVGLFAARGHERIGFLINKPLCAGDQASEEAFREECASKGRKICPVLLSHDGSNAGICAVLDRALRTSDLPNAMLVSHAGSCVTMVSHLALKRKHVGRDYGFISREDDPLLEFLEPAVARYRYEPDVYSRKVLDLVAKLSHGRRIARRHIRLMPDFVEGNSMECDGFEKTKL